MAPPPAPPTRRRKAAAQAGSGTRSPAFRPLLKWPGGKGREWDEIAPLLPRTIRHFADPFMGGLAPFARTPFTGRAWLNDRHERLVDVHRRVQAGDADLVAEVAALGRAWDDLGPFAAEILPVFAGLVADARAGARVPDDAAVPAVEESLPPSAAAAAAHIAAGVADKARRVAALERKHGVSFDDAALADHCETAVRGGFYFFVREREPRSAGARAAADFLFVRDYCYGSMFRHNAAGAFNIPYGGTTYNTKRFSARLTRLVDPATLTALARAEFSCGDFEPFLARVARKLGPADFVFADPPYDSDFKSYGPQAFSQEDHVRLAKSLAALPCPWLLVIKETDFVRATYLSPALRRSGAREVRVFGKAYGYNVRGRNERRTRHLAVANYDPPADAAVARDATDAAPPSRRRRTP